ncbi:molybdenum ABC transporter ATP-binding protein ModC [Caviibacterium pharyngocola]|uniref:Molybdenum ABC transporter ATP-binding protein n=1 Tax=Caviibacterium pharyngocola TaxID=28159 RepID=A0A2M8RSY4_9PAST|nr:molybdenum ABC transporter ATP-binding protein ModC [Caviibacterium pharyngocola]PJG81979.1 molybdenum ABC transporter ATP-binding protein [Caviibacterium pharyngocola]
MLEISVRKKLGQLDFAADLQIPNQGITALFGLSGSGKSSLINLIGGLIAPDQGFIRLNNRTLTDTQRGINLPPNHRHIGYVFQDARLFPHYTAKGNLCYGCKKENKAKLERIVELLGIGHLLKRYPITLSGGEKQRVAIGRALLTEPEILLMDEPLSALDLPRKRELLAYLETLSKEIQIPILYVTHSLDELLRLAERVVLLDEGKVKAYDVLENVWQSPLFSAWKTNNERSALLSLPVQSHHSAYNMSALDINGQTLWVGERLAAVGKKVRVCIMASDVSLALRLPEKSSIRNILTGKITALFPQPNQMRVEIAIGEQKIWSDVSLWSADELNLSVGQAVYAQIKAVSVVR